MNKRALAIVVGTVFQDAGEATRSMEIAKSIMKHQPDDTEARIIFCSHGSRFEQNAIDSGFEIYHAKQRMAGKSFYQDLKSAPVRGEFIGEKSIAIELIKGELKAYEELKPDIVPYGFWPIAGIARRMAKKEIPGICFVPLPLAESFLDVIPDVPDQINFLAAFPRKIKLWIFRRVIPRFIKKKDTYAKAKKHLGGSLRSGLERGAFIEYFRSAEGRLDDRQRSAGLLRSKQISPKRSFHRPAIFKNG